MYRPRASFSSSRRRLRRALAGSASRSRVRCISPRTMSTGAGARPRPPGRRGAGPARRSRRTSSARPDSPVPAGTLSQVPSYQGLHVLFRGHTRRTSLPPHSPAKKTSVNTPVLLYITRTSVELNRGSLLFVVIFKAQTVPAGKITQRCIFEFPLLPIGAIAII